MALSVKAGNENQQASGGRKWWLAPPTLPDKHPIAWPPPGPPFLWALKDLVTFGQRPQRGLSRLLMSCPSFPVPLLLSYLLNSAPGLSLWWFNRGGGGGEGEVPTTGLP